MPDEKLANLSTMHHRDGKLVLQAEAGSAVNFGSMQEQGNCTFFDGILKSKEESLRQYRLEDMSLHTL